MKKVLFLFLFLLSSCASYFDKRPQTIDFGDSLSNPFKEEMSSYIKDLNKQVDKEFFRFGNVFFGKKIIIVYYKDQKKANVAGIASPSFTYCEVGIFPVAIKNNILKTTIWHELGHCVGLKHKGKIGEIMSEIAQPFEKYDSNKIKSFINDFKGAIEPKD